MIARPARLTPSTAYVHVRSLDSWESAQLIVAMPVAWATWHGCQYHDDANRTTHLSYWTRLPLSVLLQTPDSFIVRSRDSR